MEGHGTRNYTGVSLDWNMDSVSSPKVKKTSRWSRTDGLREISRAVLTTITRRIFQCHADHYGPLEGESFVHFISVNSHQAVHTLDFQEKRTSGNIKRQNAFLFL